MGSAVPDPSTPDQPIGPHPIGPDLADGGGGRHHAGRVLAGRYELVRLIASGGMAQVWEATDRVLERPVAVKVLHPHLAADDTFRLRFRGEAIAAARLRHPSIVSIFDTCHDAGTEAIVMELARSRTLRQYLDERGRLTSAEAVQVGADVADALEAAHRAGIVHRDIKPANILLCDDGRVVVTDFGIAKVRDDADLTSTGMMLGTVKYLAPEQVRGEPVDARTDVYALGVVLYEAVCGVPPFTAETPVAIALARLGQPAPDPRATRADLPPSLAAVINRALERGPGHRFQRAADLRAAILAPRVTPSTTADPTAAVARPAGDATRAHPRPAATGTQPTASGHRAADVDAATVGRASAPPSRPPTSPPDGPVPPAGSANGSGPRGEVPPRGRRRSRWLIPLLFLLLVGGSVTLAVALVMGVEQASNVGPSGDPADPAPATTPQAVPVAEVVTLDPAGDGEHEGERANVIDGDPRSAWRTERYNQAELAPTKPGLGLALVLEEGQPLSELVVTTLRPGWSGRVYVAAQYSSVLGEWGAPVADVDATTTTSRVDLGGATGGAVLLWLTNVGPSGRVEVAEMSVTS